MTDTEKHIALRRIRASLLRIVCFWLVSARLFFRSKKDRVLPHRLGIWVSVQIYKIEKTIYYIKRASNLLTRDAELPLPHQQKLTINDVIARLKAAKKR